MAIDKEKLSRNILSDMGMDIVGIPGDHYGQQHVRYLGASRVWDCPNVQEEPVASKMIHGLATNLKNSMICEIGRANHTTDARFVELPVIPQSFLSSYMVIHPPVAVQTCELIEEGLEKFVEHLQGLVGGYNDKRAHAQIQTMIDSFHHHLASLGLTNGKIKFKIEPEEITMWVERWFETMELEQHYVAFHNLFDNLRLEYSVYLGPHVLKLGEPNEFTVYSSGSSKTFSLYLPLPLEPRGLEQVMRERIEDIIIELEAENA